MVQIVHISDKAVIRQKKSHSGQQHGKVNPVISILGLGILRNCPKSGKKEKKDMTVALLHPWDLQQTPAMERQMVLPHPLWQMRRAPTASSPAPHSSQE